MRRIRVTPKRKRNELPNPRDRSGKIRRAVLKRDDYTCQGCDNPYPESMLECDHTIPLSAGGADTVDNCRTLCIPCHSVKTNEERHET